MAIAMNGAKLHSHGSLEKPIYRNLCNFSSFVAQANAFLHTIRGKET